MAEFPAMPLWTDAYLGDTTHLTTIEHGAYLLLLIVAWRSRDNRLPDDDRLLARYAKMTAGQWSRIRPIVADFFEINGGFWTQRRLTDEANLVRQRRESQAAAGRASALKRKGRHSTERERSDDKALTPTPTPTTLEGKPSNSITASRRKTKSALPHKWLPKPFGDGTDCKAIIDDWSEDRFKSEVESFRAHHGSRANVMADWQQAWATWVLNSKKFDRRTTNGAGNDRSGIDRTTAAAERAFGPAHEWTDDQPF